MRRVMCFVVSLVLVVSVHAGVPGGAGVPGVASAPEQEVRTELRRSLDDPQQEQGRSDPKLVPIALTLVGLLAAIGVGTLVVTLVVRWRRGAGKG